jgi:hypothetical protein
VGATDVLRLAVAAASLLVVVAIGALFDEAIVGFVADLLRGIETLPTWLVTGVVLLGQILGVSVIVGGGGCDRASSVVSARGRGGVAAARCCDIARPSARRLSRRRSPRSTRRTRFCAPTESRPRRASPFLRPSSPQPLRGLLGRGDAA